MWKLTGVHRLWGTIMVNAVVAGCLLLGAGCSSKAKTTRHLERAGKYVQTEKYREAVIEYMNVLKLDPTNRMAIKGMGMTLCEMGEVRAAIPNLLKAEELDLNDVDVRLKLGALYLIMGDKGRARERAEAVLKRMPDNFDALVLWGAGVSTSNEVVAAIARLSASAAKFEDQPRFYVTLASLHVSRGDLAAAEEVYQKALEKIPKSWELQLARGDLYLRKRDRVRAGEAYRMAADLSPEKSMAKVRLARFCWTDGKQEEAVKILDDLIKRKPPFSAAIVVRAEIALSERDYEVARQLLDGILKTEPSNLEAFLLIQRVKLAQGKDDEVIAAYEKLASAFPKSAQGRFLLGTAWLHKGDLRKAIGEYERAVKLEADHAGSVRVLAELYIRSGQPDLALTLLKSFSGRHPGEGFAYVLGGAAYGEKKDFAQAADIYRKYIKLMPADPQGPYLLGLALRRQGRDVEATAMFEEAMRLDSGFMEALEQLVGMLITRSKNENAAVERVEKQIDRNPGAAGLHYLLGNVLSQKQDWDKAEKAFLKAIELKPEIAAAYLGLSSVYMETHKEEQALGKLDSALAVNSNDVASLMMKGTILMNRNDTTNAAVLYLRVLTVRPSFVPALNNLACLYQDSPGLKEKAFEFAKRARSVAPQDPRVADTLGWILYQRGEYKWAMALLQEAAEKMAGQSEAQYHLGMCQAALGNEDKARTSLSRALELSKGFPGSGEAAGMLSVLSVGLGSKELSSGAQVEAFLGKHPDNPFAMLKGGAYYEQAGQFERARLLYEQANSQNGRFVPALICLAKLWAGPLRQLDRAMGFARQAREEAPEDPATGDTLALIMFRKGDFKWAQSLIMESIDRGGGTPERRYLLGMISYGLGKTDVATNLMAQALSESAGKGVATADRQFLEQVQNPGLAMAKNPITELTNNLTVENLPLVMYVAGTYEQKQEKARAQALYAQVVAQYPGFCPAIRQLALTYSGQTNISEPEFKVLVKARELLPDDPEVGAVLGEAAYLKGQYEWASRLLQESSVNFPRRADVYYYLGMSYQQLKNPPAAKKYLTRALELDPKSEWAAVAQERLRQLQ